MSDSTPMPFSSTDLAVHHRGSCELALLLNGLLWSAATPLWQGPDENGHLAATQFGSEHLRLPGHDDSFGADEVLLAADLADGG